MPRTDISAQRTLGACFARSTPPPVRPRPHDHDDPHEHRHGYRPKRSSFSVVFCMIMAAVAVGVVAVLALVGREEPASFNDLKAALGIPATGSIPAFDMNRVELTQRLERAGCKPRAEIFEGGYLYLYYEVREGQAQIVLDRDAWLAGKARIQQIALR